MTTRVISICSIQHASVWTLTSQLLPRFVHADEYIVYVPRDEVEQFRRVTDPRVQVLTQEELSKEYESSLRQAVTDAGNMERFGWYLQQFHKYEALLRATADRVVIWDADCVPVKPIELFNAAGHPIYMYAGEFNPDYFPTVERLLGLRRLQDRSFVIPGFPMPANWVRDFFADMEEHCGGLRWYEAIIRNTDFRLRAGFSETETLGTWVTNIHPDAWASSDYTWERRGQSQHGYAKHFTADSLTALATRAGLDIITFENWDLRGVRGALRRVRHRILLMLGRM